jgi:hypothetical protein
MESDDRYERKKSFEVRRVKEVSHARKCSMVGIATKSAKIRVCSYRSDLQVRPRLRMTLG